MNKYYFLHAFLCMIFSVYANGQYKSNRDSLKLVIANNPSAFEALSRLAQTYEEVNADSSLYYAEILLKKATEANSHLYLSKAFLSIGNYYLVGNKLDSSIYYFQKASDHGHQFNDKIQEGVSVSSLGQALINKGQLKEGIQYLNTALQLLESDADTSRAARGILNCYGFLGDAYYLAGVYDKALENQFKSLALNEHTTDNVSSGISCNSIGSVYNNLEDYPKSESYYRKGLNYFKQENYELAEATTYYNLAEIFFKQKRIQDAILYVDTAETKIIHSGTDYNLSSVYALRAEIEKTNHNYLKASTYFEKAIQLNRTAGAQTQLGQAIAGYANLKKEQLKYQEAKQLYDTAIAIFSKENLKKELKDTYKEAADLFLKMNNLPQAIQFFHKYDSTANAFLNAEKQQEIIRQEIRYESSLKEATINTQKTEIEARRKQTYLYLSLALVALLAAGILYWFLIRVRKQKQIIEKQKDEILHNTRNNLQLLINIFNRQADHHDIKNRAIDNQGRLQTLTLLNQFLYHNPTNEKVMMLTYMKELCEYKRMTIDHLIEIKLDVDEIELPTGLAKDIGLIVNELLTNSIKYAFDTIAKPFINISLHREQNILKLYVHDNGIGMKTINEYKLGQSFGLGFVNDLVEQHHGEMKMFNMDGFKIEIQLKFKVNA